MKKIISLVLKHKVIAAICLIALSGVAFLGIKSAKKTETNYVLASVEKGTIVSSVTGTGQVSASNQIDIKSKVSGILTYIGIAEGQVVKEGDLIAQIDSSDALQAVREAELSLESAKLSLEDMKEPADSLLLLQAQNALLSAQESKNKAEEDLEKNREDGFNEAGEDLDKISAAINDLDAILFDYSIASNQQNITWYLNQTSSSVTGEREEALEYQEMIYSSYSALEDAYEKNRKDYREASQSLTDAEKEALLLETYNTSQLALDTVRKTISYVNFVADVMEGKDISIPSVVLSQKTELTSLKSEITQISSSLFSYRRSIQSGKESLTNYERTILEKRESLEKLEAGPDELDIRLAELSVSQKESNLQDAKERYANCYIKAAFDGVMLELNSEIGDEVTTSSIIGTLVTDKEIAEISLNEVDASKVKVGQKATITFDAVDDLTVTGEVVDVDSLGTTNQGVVTYTAKIAFDTESDQVKLGMSVSASIITELKQEVLSIPSSAVKSDGDIYYVEVPQEEVSSELLASAGSGIALKGTPLKKTVEVGISDDSATEIVSGLSEGDQVIVQTKSSDSTEEATTKTSSSAGIFQMSGGGPGMMR